MLFEEYEKVYEKATELCEREGISFSLLVARALAEYLNIHYPGNPQMPIAHEVPFHVRLETRIMKRDLEALLKVLKRCDSLWFLERKDSIIKRLKACARHLQRDGDEELKRLIDEAWNTINELVE